MSEEPRWIKVGPLPGAMQLEMLGGILKERDIPFYYVSDWEAGAFGTKGFTGVSTPGYVFVQESDEETVADLIEGMFGGNVDERPEDDQ